MVKVLMAPILRQPLPGRGFLPTVTGLSMCVLTAVPGSGHYR